MSVSPLRPPQQHEEIAAHLRDEIFTGRIPAGEPLPSEADLCEQFNSSRGPVRQAMATLRAEGLISSGRGRRSLVLSNIRTESFEEILSNTAWIVNLGKAPGQVLEHYGLAPLPEHAADVLRVPGGDEAVTVQRTRTADGAPLVIESLYFHPSVTNALDGVDPKHDSIHRRLVSSGIDFNNLSRALTVHAATDNEADALDIAPGTPVIQVEMRVFDHSGRPVELAVQTYRADMITIGLNNVRGHSSPLWFEIDS